MLLAWSWVLASWPIPGAKCGILLLIFNLRESTVIISNTFLAKVVIYLFAYLVTFLGLGNIIEKEIKS